MFQWKVRTVLRVAGVAVAVSAVAVSSAAQASGPPASGERPATAAPGECDPTDDGYGDAGDLFVLNGEAKLSWLDGPATVACGAHIRPDRSRRRRAAGGD